jgi:serine/threonine protein kinase
MAYECLTGRPVWNTDQGVAMTFAAIATSQLPMPSRLRPRPSGIVRRVVQARLERDPDKRFQTARELAEELAKALGAAPISLANVWGICKRVRPRADREKEAAGRAPRGGPRLESPGFAFSSFRRPADRARRSP